MGADKPFYKRDNVVTLCSVDTLNEKFGVATIVQVISGNGPKVGEMVHLGYEVRRDLRGDEQGGWVPGDQVVLTIRSSDDPGRHPWVATNANLRHSKNVRKPRQTVEELAKKIADNSYPDYGGQISKIFKEATLAGLGLADLCGDEAFMNAFWAACEAMESRADDRGFHINVAISELRKNCAHLVAVRMMCDHDAEAASHALELLE